MEIRTLKRSTAYVGIFAATGLIRVINNNRFGLSPTEVFEIQSALSDDLLALINIHLDAMHAPLWPMLLWPWVRIGGANAEIARLLPAVLGIAGVALCVWAGSRQMGARSAALCGAWLAVAPFHVEYSRSIRCYAAHFLLVGLVYVATGELARKGGFARAALVAAGVCAALSNHLMAGAMFSGLVPVWWIMYRDKPHGRWVFGALAAGLLLSLPVVASILSRTYIDPDLEDAGGIWLWQCLQHWTGTAAIAAVPLFVWLTRWRRDELRAWAAQLTALVGRDFLITQGLLVGTPAVLILALSLVGIPLGRVEYMIPAMMPLAMLIGAALVTVPERIKVPVMLAVMAPPVMWCTVIAATDSSYVSRDRGYAKIAVEWLAKQPYMPPRIVIHPAFLADSFRYYRNRTAKRIPLPEAFPASVTAAGIAGPMLLIDAPRLHALPSVQKSSKYFEDTLGEHLGMVPKARVGHADVYFLDEGVRVPGRVRRPRRPGGWRRNHWPNRGAGEIRHRRSGHGEALAAAGFPVLSVPES